MAVGRCLPPLLPTVGGATHVPARHHPCVQPLALPSQACKRKQPSIHRHSRHRRPQGGGWQYRYGSRLGVGGGCTPCCCWSEPASRAPLGAFCGSPTPDTQQPAPPADGNYGGGSCTATDFSTSAAWWWVAGHPAATHGQSVCAGPCSGCGPPYPDHCRCPCCLLQAGRPAGNLHDLLHQNHKPVRHWLPPCACTDSHTNLTPLAHHSPVHRQDAASDRLTYFEVRVGPTDPSTNSTVNPLCAWYTTPAQGVYSLTCTTPMGGRYVTIRLPLGYTRHVGDPGTFLTICEVQVYGTLA